MPPHVLMLNIILFGNKKAARKVLIKLLLHMARKKLVICLMLPIKVTVWLGNGRLIGEWIKMTESKPESKGKDPSPTQTFNLEWRRESMWLV